MIHLYDAAVAALAAMAIKKAAVSSEVEVLNMRGINPREVFASRLKEIEQLARVIGILITITRELERHNIPCLNPMRAYVLSQELDDHDTEVWETFLKEAQCVRDAWNYILEINDLSPRVVNKIEGFNERFFEKMLDTSLSEFKRFAFTPPH